MPSVWMPSPFRTPQHPTPFRTTARILARVARRRRLAPTAYKVVSEKFLPSQHQPLRCVSCQSGLPGLQREHTRRAFCFG